MSLLIDPIFISTPIIAFENFVVQNYTHMRVDGQFMQRRAVILENRRVTSRHGANSLS